MKPKKGQILIIVLMIMAIGLIVISPLLHYVDTSYNIYLRNLKATNAYYATDAMMEYIINDIFSGIDVYNQNISTPYNQLNYLNSGFDINVTISNTVALPLPPPKAYDEPVVLDPGIPFGLGTLAAGATHDYNIYLLGNTSVEVNWPFNDGPKYGAWGFFCYNECDYFTNGSISIYKCTDNSSNCSTRVLQYGPITGQNTSAQLQLNTKWNVSAGQSGWYTIRFKNQSWRMNQVAFWGCACSGNEPSSVTSRPFSGANESNYTWVKIGKQVGGEFYLYQDYTVKATAEQNNKSIVSITAYVRHSPGPLAWWKTQTVEIPTWQVTYY